MDECRTVKNLKCCAHPMSYSKDTMRRILKVKFALSLLLRMCSQEITERIIYCHEPCICLVKYEQLRTSTSSFLDMRELFPL